MCVWGPEIKKKHFIHIKFSFLSYFFLLFLISLGKPWIFSIGTRVRFYEYLVCWKIITIIIKSSYTVVAVQPIGGFYFSLSHFSLFRLNLQCFCFFSIFIPFQIIFFFSIAMLLALSISLLAIQPNEIFHFNLRRSSKSLFSSLFD